MQYRPTLTPAKLSTVMTVLLHTTAAALTCGKLLGLIDWPWLWVTAPVWAPEVLGLLAIAMSYLLEKFDE